jgi:hypothetical protein
VSSDRPDAPSEYRVPTKRLAADVICTDGARLSGTLFLPASTTWHSGPMLPEERLNDESDFFPFLVDDGEPTIVNKDQVLVLTFDNSEVELPVPNGEAAESPLAETGDFSVPERPVALDCGELHLEGGLPMDVPPHQQRVLDFLNRPQRFILLNAGDQVHLINRARITRARELPET